MSAGEKRLSGTERALLLAEAALAASAANCETGALGAFAEGALWPLGALAAAAWLPDEGEGLLRFERRALRLRAMVPGRVLAALEAGRIAPGAGLAGDAWRRGRSCSGPAASGRAPWDQVMSDAGLEFSAALPVFHEGRLSAVLQFYARGRAAFTEDLLARLDRLGPALGDLLARKRGEARRQQTLLADLHDDVGQTLAGLALLAHAFHRAPGRTGLGAKAAQLSRLANEATAKVRLLADSMESSPFN